MDEHILTLRNCYRCAPYRHRRHLAKKILTAPFDDILGLRLADIGEYLFVGTSVVEINMLNPILVEFTLSEKELAIVEAVGIVLVILFQGKRPRTATLEYLQKYGTEMQTAFEQVPGYDETFMLVGMTSPNAVFGGFKMKP